VVTDSDKCPGLAASVGTIPQFDHVSKALLRRRWHLTSSETEASQHRLFFRELAVQDLNMWERHILRTHKWPQSMEALRLDKCKEEAERQG